MVSPLTEETVPRCGEHVDWWDGEYEGDCELPAGHDGDHFDGLSWFNDAHENTDAPHQSVATPRSDVAQLGTVALLTKAADLADQAAEALVSVRNGKPLSQDEFMYEFLRDGWFDDAARALAASGPDHWRAVAAMLREASRVGTLNCACCRATASMLRPLAELVVQQLGDTTTMTKENHR